MDIKGDQLINSQSEIKNPPSVIKPKKKGALSIRNRKVAELAARGWDVDGISKECNLTRSRTYHILRSDEVMEYVIDILKETFNEGDRILSMLYKKAMMGLDEDLCSSNPEIRHKAREQVLKCWGFKDSGQGEKGNQFSFIQQIFQGAGGRGSGSVETMDDIILRMRKERGLELEDGAEDVVDAEIEEINRIERESDE